MTRIERNPCRTGAVVAIFDSWEAVQEACFDFRRNDLTMSAVSFACRAEAPDGVETDTDTSAFYPRDLGGMLFGFNIRDPRLGAVFIAGAIAVRTAYDIETTFAARGDDHLNASLACVSVPDEYCAQCVSELELGRMLLIVDGPADRVEIARQLLKHTRAISALLHLSPAALSTRTTPEIAEATFSLRQ